MTKKYDMVQLKKLLTEFEVATGAMERLFNECCATVLPETKMLPKIVTAVSSGSEKRLQDALKQYRSAVEREQSVNDKYDAAIERHTEAKQAFLAAIGLA